MMRVGSKELKNRLGKYLALVRNGTVVQITDRGHPIACIIPAAAAEAEAQWLGRLAAQGTVTAGSGEWRRHKPTVLRKGKTIVRMLAEERR